MNTTTPTEPFGTSDVDEMDQPGVLSQRVNNWERARGALTPGLKAAARVLSREITQLEADILRHHQAGNDMQALYAAQTAAYLRQFLARFIGPTWHVWAQPDVADPETGSDGR